MLFLLSEREKFQKDQEKYDARLLAGFSYLVLGYSHDLESGYGSPLF